MKFSPVLSTELQLNDLFLLYCETFFSSYGIIIVLCCIYKGGSIEELTKILCVLVGLIVTFKSDKLFLSVILWDRILSIFLQKPLGLFSLQLCVRQIVYILFFNVLIYRINHSFVHRIRKNLVIRLQFSKNNSNQKRQMISFSFEKFYDFFPF